LATTLLQAACCYGMARALIRRKAPDAMVSAEPSLATWHASDSWVWGLIITLGLVASGLMTSTKGIAFFLGLNLALLYVVIYAVQGLSLVEFMLRKARVGTVWRTLILSLIVALPVIVPMIALGVVDIWADFRKVRTAPKTP